MLAVERTALNCEIDHRHVNVVLIEPRAGCGVRGSGGC